MALIDEFEASGLHVTARVDGDLDGLPGAVDLAGYRLIHEALTNAQKHGSGPRAHIWVDRDDARLRLVVTNPVAGDHGAGSGHGLLGVRERVSAAGGRLDAGREGGSFRVEATMPLRADEADRHEGAA